MADYFETVCYVFFLFNNRYAYCLCAFVANTVVGIYSNDMRTAGNGVIMGLSPNSIFNTFYGFLWLNHVANFQKTLFGDSP